MKIEIQRLRNLTTDKLHGKIDYYYEDIEMIIGKTRLMSYMLPRARKAILPWLKKNIKDPLFWNGELDLTHTGEIELPEPTDEEREAMNRIYMETKT